MEGKGWFIIYGLLLLFTGFLMFSQVHLSGKVDQLQREVVALKTQPSAQVVSASPTPRSLQSVQPEESPEVDTSTPQARDEKRKTDLADIKTALAEFKAAKKRYPADLKELAPKYLDPVPTDPLSPKYSYRYKRTDAGFRLTAVLEATSDPDDVKSDGKKDQIYTVTEKST